MSKESTSGDATGWRRGAKGIDGVGEPLVPFARRTSRKAPMRKKPQAPRYPRRAD
jgi:hypothetical protein